MSEKRKARPPQDVSEPRGRIDLRADPEFVARVEAQAKRFGGIGLSAYIRAAVAERLERDEASDPSKAK